MSTMTKFLALMPLVVLGAACNGVSPMAPDSPLLADEAADTIAESKDAASSCSSVTGVQLKLVPSTTQAGIVVEATYLGFGPSFSHCGAPAWSSNPRGSLTPQMNAFRVGVLSNREVVVTAQAPNGISGRITIHARPVDTSASTTVCQGVTGVELKLVPSTTVAGLVVEAKYLGFGPSLGSCPAPAWSSNPRGALTPQLNAFRVGVLSNRGVVVTATTRNGVRGQIRVQP